MSKDIDVDLIYTRQEFEQEQRDRVLARVQRSLEILRRDLARLAENDWATKAEDKQGAIDDPMFIFGHLSEIIRIASVEANLRDQRFYFNFQGGIFYVDPGEYLSDAIARLPEGLRQHAIDFNA